LLMIVLIALIYGRNSTRKLRITRSTSSQRDLLANLAMDAIRRPRAWRDIRGLWQRRFIPCLGKKYTSLARIAKLGMRGRLFVGRQGDQLAKPAVRSGALVLNQTGLFASSIRSCPTRAISKSSSATSRCRGLPAPPGNWLQKWMISWSGRMRERACGQPAAFRTGSVATSICLRSSPADPPAGRGVSWPSTSIIRSGGMLAMYTGRTGDWRSAWRSIDWCSIRGCLPSRRLA